MNSTPTDLLLHNYQTLVERVDTHIKKVEAFFPGQIACEKGCDSCCRFLSLFPVEAFSLSAAYSRLSRKVKLKIAQRLEQNKNDCPLLIDHACALYHVRPIICRTHGYPIYMENDHQISIDTCPKNFQQVLRFPKEILLSVENLNQTLIAVNQHFLKNIESGNHLPDRIPIDDIITLRVKPE